MPDGSPYDGVEWLSAAELAALHIPGLPGTARSIQRIAEAQGWNTPERENSVWRHREGRGGGVEYHRCVLTSHQQAHLLLAQPMTTPAATGAAPRSERWAWYDRQTDRTKTRALERLAAVHAIYALTDSGIGKTEALNSIAHSRGIGISTLQIWDGLVRDMPREHWLPHLAPGHGGGRPQADCPKEAWRFLASLYFRQSRPNFRECWRQLVMKAGEQGWKLPAERTLYDRLMALPEPLRIKLREGEDGLRRRLPAQKRDRSVFHAMEAVNTDGHLWDVFVKWPDGTIARPQMVGFQDLYSGKTLSWRVDQTLSWHLVRLAFGDLVERYGIPRLCWMDNGREFASKKITGGQANRYRFKLKDEEPEGLMTSLGVEVHWTRPYSGQSKPIERTFRDFAQNIAKHPEFEGAYAGNSPTNKPANYGQRAVPLDRFLEVIGQGIIQHNARVGRQAATCRAGSFDATFDESFRASTVRTPTPEQRRLWMLAAEGVRVRKQDAKILFHGNEYWAEFLMRHMGQKVTVRFDPARLHEPLHVYTLDGRYLGEAQVWEASGFNSTEDAAKTARLNKTVLRAVRVQEEALALMPARDLAKIMPQIPEPDLPSPGIVQLFTGNAVPKPMPIEDAEEEVDEVTRILAGGWTPRVIEGGGDEP